MKIIKARINYLTVIMASGAQVVYNNADPVAYKDANGQWYRVKDVKDCVRRSMNLYMHKAQVNDFCVEYVGWQAMIEMVGRL